MNTRRLSVVLMVVCLPVVLIAALAAPTGLTVTVDPNAIVLDWNDVPGAVKYSVDIEGTAAYTDPNLGELTAEVEVSFGTRDRTDGGLMGDSNLTITIDEFEAALAAALGVDPGALISFEGSAEVKALDPGKGKGPQNNPFSDPAPLFP
ncbi:MAG: hypothetical protein M1376_12745 [Planctomycetes bacterium]|nr:hypothetical protein [Planctomycetota bacterium]